jgi:hypothetical protein
VVVCLVLHKALSRGRVAVQPAPVLHCKEQSRKGCPTTARGVGHLSWPHQFLFWSEKGSPVGSEAG